MSSMTSSPTPIQQLPPDTPFRPTPRQLAEAIASISAKTLAEYHKAYHTPLWKRLTMRVAAEVQSFKTAVNEEYGPQHARGELLWQRAARTLRRWWARVTDVVNIFRRDELPPGTEDELEAEAHDARPWQVKDRRAAAGHAAPKG